ncbi:MAG: hypothetical protein LBS32_06405 [Clostridiales Family XIII bacterium]|nr:hypothetical protein [Clostridiales Family XIII bacterium]
MLEDTDLLCRVCGADVKEPPGQGPGPAPTEGGAPAQGPDPAEPAPEPDPAEPAEPAPEPDPAAPAEPAPGPDPAAPHEAEAESGEGGAREAAARSETVEFQWNIHKFPDSEARKTDDIAFNWQQELKAIETAGNRAEGRPGAESRASGPSGRGAENALRGAGADEWYGPGNQEDYSDTLSDWFGAAQIEPEHIPDVWDIESAPSLPEAWEGGEARGLQGDGEAPDPTKERFFTFDRKNEEFQRLLDREYERIRSCEPPLPLPAFAMDRGIAAADVALEPAAPEQEDAVPAGEVPAEVALEQDDVSPAGEVFAEVAPEQGEAAPAGEVPAEVAPEPEDVSPAGEVFAEAAPEPEEAPPAGEAPAEVALEQDDVSPAGEVFAEAAPEQGEAAPAGEVFAEAAPEQGDAAPAGEVPEEAPPEGTVPAEAPSAAASDSAARLIEALDAMEKEQREWESRRRMGAGAKFVVTLAVIILLAAAAAVGIKLFAPDSTAALWIDFVLKSLAQIALGGA